LPSSVIITALPDFREANVAGAAGRGS